MRKEKDQRIYRLSNGKWLNKNQFIKYFEKKVLYTIRKYGLVDKRDKIGVACSGGKDSLTLTYFLFKFAKSRKQEFVAISVDEGIENYRQVLLKTTRDFCSRHGIPLKVFSFKEEFGFDLSDKRIQNKIKNLKISNCYVCSVLKRWLLNKRAREIGCKVIATAHSLDDEAENILLNLFKGNPEILAKLGPRTGVIDTKEFVQRIKPFYLCSTQEIVLYANLNNLPVPKNKSICPLRGTTFRVEIRSWLSQMEKKHVEIKNAIVKSYLKIMPIIREKFSKEKNKIKKCKNCGFVSSNEECKACLLLKHLKT